MDPQGGSRRRRGRKVRRRRLLVVRRAKRNLDGLSLGPQVEGLWFGGRNGLVRPYPFPRQPPAMHGLGSQKRRSPSGRHLIVEGTEGRLAELAVGQLVGGRRRGRLEVVRVGVGESARGGAWHGDVGWVVHHLVLGCRVVGD